VYQYGFTAHDSFGEHYVFRRIWERYELAAMKAAGISLTRVMMPLLGVTVVLSIMLYFFSNNIIPDFQRKAKNMLFNIAQTKPALNLHRDSLSIRFRETW
jgi:lipopolysaccharide export LptBFGC system permease protein LptF